MNANDSTAERLYALLPEILRLRDIEGGAPLEELVGILASQIDVLRDDLDQFYADQFIETCAEWVAPYIGDLVGYRLVHGRAPNALSSRAQIANTISYRRRKGTAAMLEQLARDVTDWPARAVEFFERLATTQYLNHLRPHAQATADLRNREALDHVTRLQGAFDDVAHLADVRRIASSAPNPRGRYNIPNIGIFLFRVQPMVLRRSPLEPQSGDLRRFRFDPLGTDTQLYSVPELETEVTQLAMPANAPLPLSVRWFDDHLADHYGPDLDINIEVAAGPTTFDPVLPADVLAADLRDVSAAAWANEPPAGKVAVDPVRGRVFFGTPLDADARPVATFVLGLAVPVGARTVQRLGIASRPARLGLPTSLPAPDHPASGGGSLQTHLNAVRGGGTVRLQDSARWTPSPTLRTDPSPAGQPPVTVAVVSDPSARPVIRAPSGIRLSMAPGSTVLLDGLMVNGGAVFLDEVGDEQPRVIVLTDCTLVPGLTRTSDGRPGSPGSASLVVLDPFATVVLDGCITGPIVAVEGVTLRLSRSVVDAGGPEAVAITGRDAPDGPRTVTSPADFAVGDGSAESGPVDVYASTVVGGLHAERLDCSDSVLLAQLPAGDPRLAPVWTQRRQVGCVRFSWLPVSSRTGRRFGCQPDPQAPLSVQATVMPAFTSLRFGDAAYAQLSADAPASIRRGAADESEMGATHDLFAPQREDDLVVRLDEYLRFGLEAGIFYAN